MVGLTAYVQGSGGGAGAAACSTVTVCEAMVMLAVRADPELRAMLSTTEPLPEPAAPDDTSIQLAGAAAVQAQPCAEVTVTVRCPPAASTEIRVGETL